MNRKRVEALEARVRLKRYNPICIIREGEPLPDNCGPGVVIIDTIGDTIGDDEE